MESTRRYDLDWLRVLAVLLLVPFHSALIFNQNPQIVMFVKDGSHSVTLDLIAGWIHQFHMPLLFFVSGAATFFSLQKRSARTYLKERFNKLLIPAILGLAFLVPPMTYITLRTEGITIGFWEHFITFWQFKGANLAGTDGKFTPAHLWYLLFLFIYSCIALPLFLGLQKEKIRKVLSRLWDIISPVSVFVLFMGLLLVSSRLQLLGDKNPVVYFLWFFGGYFFMTDSRFQIGIDQNWRWLLLAGICGDVLRHTYFSWFPSFPAGYAVLEQLNRFLWVFAILGMGHKWLCRGSRTLSRLSASSYNFYLFHLLINTLVGVMVVQWPLCIGLKYVLIVGITMGLTLMLCYTRRVMGSLDL